MAKFVPFRSLGDLDSRKVFVTVLEWAPPGAQGQPGSMGFADFERRFRVLTALRDAGAAGVVLEDADWETLKGALAGSRNWVNVPTETMGWMIDIKADLFGAKAPPKPEEPAATASDNAAA
jgi:hypothetical protein